MPSFRQPCKQIHRQLPVPEFLNGLRIEGDPAAGQAPKGLQSRRAQVLQKTPEPLESLFISFKRMVHDMLGCFDSQKAGGQTDKK